MGKLKSPLQPVDVRSAALEQQNLDDVEAEWSAGLVEQAKPFAGAADDELAFVWGDCGRRPAKELAGARFYFRENENVFVPAHDINFATIWSFEVSIEDFAAAFQPKPPLGELLALTSEIFGAAAFSAWSNQRHRTLQRAIKLPRYGR